MSQRNGDKARFGRLRRRKILQRMRARELRNALRTRQASASGAEPLPAK